MALPPPEPAKRAALESFLETATAEDKATATRTVSLEQAMAEAKQKEGDRQARERSRRRPASSPPQESGSTFGGSTFGSTHLEAQSLNPHRDAKEARQHAIAREAGFEPPLEAEELAPSPAAQGLSEEAKSMRREEANQVRQDALLGLARIEAEWGRDKGSLEEIICSKLFEIARDSKASSHAPPCPPWTLPHDLKAGFV